MNDTLVVNFGEMQHGSQSIQSALNTLNNRLNEIDQLGKRLTAGWVGDARDAYLVRQTGWQTAAGDLAIMLREIKLALDASAQQYLETENRNRQLFPPQR